MTKSCVLGFALFVLMHTPARAGVIYNSFLPGDTYSGNRGDFGWWGGTDYYEEAAAFMVPYDCSLTTIDIALGYENGPNAMTVSLFSDNAGVPGGAGGDIYANQCRAANGHPWIDHNGEFYTASHLDGRYAVLDRSGGSRPDRD